jgi:hypothetical protein
VASKAPWIRRRRASSCVLGSGLLEWQTCTREALTFLLAVL